MEVVKNLGSVLNLLDTKQECNSEVYAPQNITAPRFTDGDLRVLTTLYSAFANCLLEKTTSAMNLKLVERSKGSGMVQLGWTSDQSSVDKYGLLHAKLEALSTGAVSDKRALSCLEMRASIKSMLVNVAAYKRGRLLELYTCCKKVMALNQDVVDKLLTVAQQLMVERCKQFSLVQMSFEKGLLSLKNGWRVSDVPKTQVHDIVTDFMFEMSPLLDEYGINQDATKTFDKNVVFQFQHLQSLLPQCDQLRKAALQKVDFTVVERAEKWIKVIRLFIKENINHSSERGSTLSNKYELVEKTDARLAYIGSSLDASFKSASEREIKRLKVCCKDANKQVENCCVAICIKDDLEVQQVARLTSVYFSVKFEDWIYARLFKTCDYVNKLCN